MIFSKKKYYVSSPYEGFFMRHATRFIYGAACLFVGAAVMIPPASKTETQNYVSDDEPILHYAHIADTHIAPILRYVSLDADDEMRADES